MMSGKSFHSSRVFHPAHVFVLIGTRLALCYVVLRVRVALNVVLRCVARCMSC
jgi:hypothetical protein